MLIYKIANSHIIQAINKTLTPNYLFLNLASVCLIINLIYPNDFINTMALTTVSLLPYCFALTLVYYLTNKIPACLLILTCLLLNDQTNIILALIAALSLYLIDKYWYQYLFNNHYLKQIPKFVEDSLKNIILITLIIGFAVIFSKISIKTTWLSFIDLPITCIFIVFLYCLLFYYGYHPSLLLAILGPIQLLFLGENIQAMLSNQPVLHLFTHGSMSALANMSGTGTTIGIALLSKKLPSGTILASWFGVNENVIFGLPVTRNKQAFVPYVIGGTILGGFPFVLMSLGYLNKPIFDAPYLGLFLEAFLVNLDTRSIFVNIIQIISSIIIWKYLYKE